MPKITKRDLLFLLLGGLLMLTAVVVYDWEDFKRGLNGESSVYQSEVELSKE